MKRIFDSNKLLLIISISLLFVIQINAQSCKEVFEFCQPTDTIFNKQALSRTFKIQPNRNFKLVQILYGERGYHFNLCKKDDLGDFHIIILDDATQDILWDNSTDNYQSSVSISFGSTRRIIFDITPKNPEKFDKQSQCIGIVIKYFTFNSL
jgi:hypothetical protein